ncbi:MAG: alpha/beta hydrolase [Acidimicrobiia bacterium]|nr:alpha/beta hydrolase [Acidimicrobiia bacterium]MDQ3500849.1 alpha/beta hydrolase [Actinomycetota bacterium]
MADFYNGGHAADGPLVGLIHGAGSNHTVWRYQTRLLANRGYRVMAFDLPGHGSNPEPALRSVEGMAAWVADRIPKPGTIIGHSLGGLISLELARTRPELVERLGLFGCRSQMSVTPELQRRADAFDLAAVALIVGWSYSGHLGAHPEPGVSPAGVTARLLESELTNLGGDLAACSAYQLGSEAAGELKVPTLVVAGGHDRMAALAGVVEMAESIHDARLVVIPYGGHFMITDSPDAVRKALSTFLASP